MDQEKDAVAALCPKCGLCCNGVLFADVELQKTDAPRRLAELGLAIKAKGRKRAFSQPCHCFQAGLCQIYAERPTRCRAFECGVLKRVVDQRLTPDAALRLIKQAQQLSDKIRASLQGLGERNDALPLSHRFQKVMAEPIDLSADEALVDLRGTFMLQVDQLMKFLERNFLSSK